MSNNMSNSNMNITRKKNDMDNRYIINRNNTSNRTNMNNKSTVALDQDGRIEEAC